MLGGPSTDSLFRPLSMTVPKPLFPVAGRHLVDYPLEAFAGLRNSLQEVLLIGFYDASLFDVYIQTASARFGIRIKYKTLFDSLLII
jgi:mannose-1-phosphate guanylyltransferase